MMKKWIGLAAAMLAIVSASGTVAAQISPTVARPAAPSERDRADRLATSARSALARGDAAQAILDAEGVVQISPRDAESRTLLGRAYLAAGRFASADTAFGDAEKLDPAQLGGSISHALVQIALGHAGAAQASLASARGQASDADIGLALALLGRTSEARDLLLAAARAPDADPRTRQNLALALALEGRWTDAASVAAQDLPADKVGDRLHRWTMIAQLKSDPARQIGALIGVTPADDAGQPVALALVERPAAASVAIATPVQAAPREAATLARAVVEAVPTPLRLPARVSPARTRMPMVVAAHSGKWAVQLGAYSSPARTQSAWTRLNARAHFLGTYAPSRSDMRRGNVTLFRLAVTGFGSRAEASRLCARIRAKGGACFVRTGSGERPMQWTMRGRSGQSA